MAELFVTEYLGFMNDFKSFTKKNSHTFDVSSYETDLLLFKLAICKLLPVKFSKTQKELLQSYLLINNVISMPPEDFLVFGWAQETSVINSIETIAPLGPKI